jgi:hypothetical protein
MKRIGSLVGNWVCWSTLMLTVQQICASAYLYGCTVPIWTNVWRAFALAWSPSVLCVVLNQVQFVAQQAYLYSGALLAISVVCEIANSAVAAMGGIRPDKLNFIKSFFIPSPKESCTPTTTTITKDP